MYLWRYYRALPSELLLLACCKHDRENLWFRKTRRWCRPHFKYLKIAGAFFLISLLATVQFVIFENAGALNEELEAQEVVFRLWDYNGETWARVKFCERVSEGETQKLPTKVKLLGVSKIPYGRTWFLYVSTAEARRNTGQVYPQI